MSTQIDKPRGSVASLLEKFSQADESSKQAKIRDERMSSVRTSVGKRVSDRVLSGPWTSSSSNSTSNGAYRPSLNDNNIPPAQSGPEPKKPLKDWLSVSPMIAGKKSPGEVISVDLERIWGAKLAGIRAEDSGEKPPLDQQAIPLIGAIKPSSSFPSQQDSITTNQNRVGSESTSLDSSSYPASEQIPSAASGVASCPPVTIMCIREESSPSVTSDQTASLSTDTSKKSRKVCEPQVSTHVTSTKTAPLKSTRASNTTLKDSHSSVSPAPLPKKTSTPVTLTTPRKSHAQPKPSKTEASLPRSRKPTSERPDMVTSPQCPVTEASARKTTAPQAITPRTTTSRAATSRTAVISSTSRLYSPTASSLAKAKSPTLSPSSSSSTTIQKSPLSTSKTSLHKSVTVFGESKAIGSPSVSSRSTKTSPTGSASKAVSAPNKQSGRISSTPSNSKLNSKRVSAKLSSTPSGQVSNSSQPSPVAKSPAQKQSSTSTPASRTRTPTKSETPDAKAQLTPDREAPKNPNNVDVANVVEDVVPTDQQANMEAEAGQTSTEQD